MNPTSPDETLATHDGPAAAVDLSPNPTRPSRPQSAPTPARAGESDEERLVLAANRIFHDLEGAAYEAKHDEIFIAETARWQRVAGTWLAGRTTPRRVLDIGTGTGFVPNTIAPFLSVDDEIVCTDLSRSMLAVAKERLQRGEHICRFSFEEIDGRRYPFPSKSFHAITGNSVVHHIPDLAGFFAEIDRMLVPGGFVMIGHEPNAAHYRENALRRRAALYSKLADPLAGAIAVGKAMRLDRLARSLGVHARLRRAALEARGEGLAEQVEDSAHRLDEVGARMVDEGLVSTPPSRETIAAWIDVHSPTAGAEVDPDRGIEIDRIRDEWLPGYELAQFESYDHLDGPGHGRGGCGRAGRALAAHFDRSLAERFPGAGATFFAVLRKPESAEIVEEPHARERN